MTTESNALERRTTSDDLTVTEATSLTTLDLELRAYGASEQAHQVLLKGGPLWAVFLFVKLAEDRMNAARVVPPSVPSAALSAREMQEWVSARFPEVIAFLGSEEPTQAVQGAARLGRFDGSYPTSIEPVLVAARRWGDHFESLLSWRRAARATTAPKEWMEVVALMSTALDTLIESLERVLGQIKASLVAAREAHLRGERVPPIQLTVEVAPSPVAAVLPGAFQRAMSASRG